METTNEIKAKVFAQYLGQRWMWKDGERDFIQLYLSDINYAVFDPSNKRTLVLCLKPLSEITKEDADIVANIFFKDTKLSFEIMHKYKDGKVVLCNGITKHKKPHPLGENITFETDGQIWHDEGFDYDNVTVDAPFRVFQYLQSQGYDMPNYHLGNKTLFESGLAIYK